MRRLVIGVLLALVSSTGAAALTPVNWQPPASAFKAVAVDAPMGSKGQEPLSPIVDPLVGPTVLPHPSRPTPTAQVLTTTIACSTVVCARAYALDLLGPTQYDCLYRLVQRESGWRWWATNKTTGAYGLGQALPASKMAWAGPDWRTNPVTQLRWMIHYIATRYGTPCRALAHSYATGWY